MGMKIELSFYNAENEKEKTFIRSFVPWKLLKKAIKLQHLDKENLTEEDVNAVSELVVAVFGDQFSVEDLEDKTDIGEMLSVVTAIVAAANGIANPNPPPPGK